MDYREINNNVLSECVDLVNNIKELPDHIINERIENYIPFIERENLKLLQLSKHYIAGEKLELVDRTIKIASDIDNAINEYKYYSNVDNLKALIKDIDRFYSLNK